MYASADFTGKIKASKNYTILPIHFLGFDYFIYKGGHSFVFGKEMVKRPNLVKNHYYVAEHWAFTIPESVAFTEDDYLTELSKIRRGVTSFKNSLFFRYHKEQQLEVFEKALIQKQKINQNKENGGK